MEATLRWRYSSPSPSCQDCSTAAQRYWRILPKELDRRGKGWFGDVESEPEACPDGSHNVTIVDGLRHRHHNQCLYRTNIPVLRSLYEYYGEAYQLSKQCPTKKISLWWPAEESGRNSDTHWSVGIRELLGSHVYTFLSCYASPYCPCPPPRSRASSVSRLY